MKLNVLIAGCLALLILCTCAVAGVPAAESYKEPDAMVGGWGDMEVAPTDVINLTAPNEAESSSTLIAEYTAATTKSQISSTKLQTEPATPVTSTSAVLHGKLINYDDGDNQEYSICFRYEGGGVGKTKVGYTTVSANNPSYEFTLTGLKPGTTYYYRAVHRDSEESVPHSMDASEPKPFTTISVLAKIPEDLLNDIDSVVDSQGYIDDWEISRDQFKIMLAALAYAEVGNCGYGAHSNDEDDKWHKDLPGGFHFSGGLGPFQITVTEPREEWTTLDKLNSKKALDDTIKRHKLFSEGNFKSLEDLRLKLKKQWFSYNVSAEGGGGHFEIKWGHVTGTNWDDVKDTNKTTLDSPLDWELIKESIKSDEKESDVIKDIGIKKWTIIKDDEVKNHTGGEITLDKNLRTWLISAKMTSYSFKYYYTYDEDQKIEIWAYSNSSPDDDVYDKRSIFVRTYNKPKPQRVADNDYRLTHPVLADLATSKNVDVALVIDSSGSMSWNDPKDDRLKAAKMFIDIIGAADQIAVVSFDSSAKVQKGLTRVGGNEIALKSAIDKIGSSGSTNIGDGLRKGYNELDSVAANPEHKKAAILLTDGEHNTGTEPSSVVPDYRAKGWPIYTIGFTTEADVKLLKDISEETGGEYYTSLKSDTLKDIYTRISQSVTGYVQVETQNGKIAKDETITGSLPVDFSIMAFNLALFWPGSDLDLVLYYPDGDKVTLNQSNPNGTDDPDISYISQDTYEIYKVQNPQPGAWNYDIVGVDVTGQKENYTLALSASTTIKLDAHTDKLDYDMGEGVKITANFTEDDVGIVNAQATASITLPDLSQGTLVLSDSGGGVYEGTFYATQPGHYSVLVEVQRGLDVVRQKQIEFDVSMRSVPGPIANFTADRTSGIAPLPVQFTDIPAGGTPAIWEWNFGDGNTATVQNPTYIHNYTVAGTYTVKLTTTNAGGCNTSTKVDYITIMRPAPVDISSDSSGDDSSVSTGSALTSGNGVSFSFTGLPVSTITIESGADISRALIIAEQIRSLPGSITPPKSETYQYLEITLHRLESADFDEALISFNVPVGYLSAMGMKTTDVALMRYTDGQWVHLKTILVKEEGGRAYYEAVTPGFSVFAIVLEKNGATVEAPVLTPVPVATVGEEEEKNREEPDVVEPEVSLTSTPTPVAASAATPTPKEAPVIYAPIGLIVAGLLAFALRRRE